jgi:hypothetical protein
VAVTAVRYRGRSECREWLTYGAVGCSSRRTRRSSGWICARCSSKRATTSSAKRRTGRPRSGWRRNPGPILSSLISRCRSWTDWRRPRRSRAPGLRRSSF